MQYRAALAWALLGALLALVPSCQGAASKPDFRSSPFGRDMDRICNAVEQSGASAEPVGAHQLLVAQWLGANLESQEGRAFLGRLARVEGEAKAKALEEEARKVGLARCPTADAWRAPVAK